MSEIENENGSSIDEEFANMAIKDFINTQFATISEDSNVKTAISIIVNKKLMGIPVINVSDKLVGIVSEKDGNPIVAANIILEGTRLGCASDHLGAFMITKIPPGEYALIVSAPNYGKQKIGKVIMKPNKTTVVALKIKKK